MGIRIIKAGMLTSVQDLGRRGYQDQGIGTSGVMDVRNFKIANLLLDNAENEAVLEFTLIGPTLEFTSDTIISITGGDFTPKLNGELLDMYKAIYVSKGDLLTFGSAKSGSRGYIAFSSYLNIPVVMGSRSTNIKSGIGGFEGRKLQNGDYLHFRIKRRYLPFFLSRKLEMPEYSDKTQEIRVILGPQAEMFTKTACETFLSASFTVTSEFDRMGCRLDGPFIAAKDKSDIISDPTTFGSIQIPSHGKPIILLSDRQTTGGYAKIATVATVDLSILVQRKVDSKIKFKAITVEQAQQLIIDEVREMDEYRKLMQRPCKEVLESRLVAKRLRKLFE